jgi:hypothetical protein
VSGDTVWMGIDRCGGLNVLSSARGDHRLQRPARASDALAGAQSGDECRGTSSMSATFEEESTPQYATESFPNSGPVARPSAVFFKRNISAPQVVLQDTKYGVGSCQLA